jgi:uncharacterized protein YndB with AHSA1/START domain
MSQNLTLHLDKVIRAPRSRVFAAWTQPEELMHWFAPGPLRAKSINVDLRVGGAFRWAFLTPSPDGGEPMEIAFSGAYQEIVPDVLLRFHWKSELQPEDSTVVTVAFTDVDGGTQVALTQERILNQEIYNRNSGGWASMLEKLDGLLEPAIA